MKNNIGTIWQFLFEFKDIFSYIISIKFVCELSILFLFLAHFPYFEKKKVG
jgi:hypothetical protein